MSAYMQLASSRWFAIIAAISALKAFPAKVPQSRRSLLISFNDDWFLSGYLAAALPIELAIIWRVENGHALYAISYLWFLSTAASAISFLHFRERYFKKM